MILPCGSVEDCYRREIDFNGSKVMLEIIDTAGTEQFTSMVELYIKNCQVGSRLNSYPGTSQFLAVVTSAATTYHIHHLHQRPCRPGSVILSEGL